MARSDASGAVHPVDEKTLPMATITGRTDGQTDRQSATHNAAPPREEGRIVTELACKLNFDGVDHMERMLLKRSAGKI